MGTNQFSGMLGGSQMPLLSLPDLSLALHLLAGWRPLQVLQQQCILVPALLCQSRNGRINHQIQTQFAADSISLVAMSSYSFSVP